MSHSRQNLCLIISFIIVISDSNGGNIQLDKPKDDGGAENLPPEFMSFVKGLDSMVFQSERKKNITEVKPTLKKHSKKLANRRYFNKDIKKESETAAIRDILMLKLVSYYEDKYNVARTKTYTTPQMLEPLGGRRALRVPDSIEQTARLHSARKVSNSYTYTQNVQDTNALEPYNQQETIPVIEEVIAL